MQTNTHVQNAATDSYAENNTSVRQVIDSQEYPVAKGDIIKKGFYLKAAVEKCVAYLHGLSQFPGCNSYKGDIIILCA